VTQFISTIKMSQLWDRKTPKKAWLTVHFALFIYISNKLRQNEGKVHSLEHSRATTRNAIL